MRSKAYTIALPLTVLALLVAGCGTIKTTSPATTESTAALESDPTEVASYNWNQLLSRDSILPIYDPEFVPAGEAGYDDDELVMGIRLRREAFRSGYVIGVTLEDSATAFPYERAEEAEVINDAVGPYPVVVHVDSEKHSYPGLP